MNAAERRVALVAGTSHLFTHGTMTLLPGVLVVLAADQALGFFSLGAIVNLGYFLFGLGSIPAGILVDRLGARKVLELGNLGMAFSCMLTGLAPNSALFALAYALLGASASLYHPAGLALIAKHIEKKGKALALHGVLGNVGLSLAPLFAGAMVYLFDTWRAAYVGFGILGLVFCAVVRLVRPGHEPALTAGDLLALFQRRAWRAPEPAGDQEDIVLPLSLIVAYAGAIAFGLVYRGSLTYFPVLFQREVSFIAQSERPAVLAGMVTSAILALGMLGQWAGGTVTDRLKRPELGHLVIYLVVIPSALLLGALSDAPLLAAGVAFSMVFYGWQPLQNAMVARLTTSRTYGRAYGMNFFLIMGMGSVATALGGYLVDHHGVDRVYTVLGYVGILGFLSALGVGWSARHVVRFRFRVERTPEDAASTLRR